MTLLGTVRTLGFAILARTVYRRLVLLGRPLDASMPRFEARIPITIDVLKPDEAAEYVAFNPTLTLAEVQRRLAAGHWCFVVRYIGAMVHAGWAVAGRAWIDYLDCELPLGAGEVYQYGSYTTPAYRGLDLAGARVAAMAAWLSTLGYNRVLAAVLPENATAFRPLEKVGYRPIGWIGVVGCGRWRKTVGLDRPTSWNEIRHAFDRPKPLEETIPPHHVLGSSGRDA